MKIAQNYTGLDWQTGHLRPLETLAFRVSGGGGKGLAWAWDGLGWFAVWISAFGAGGGERQAHGGIGMHGWACLLASRDALQIHNFKQTMPY